jgi:hypothetical protein
MVRTLALVCLVGCSASGNADKDGSVSRDAVLPPTFEPGDTDLPDTPDSGEPPGPVDTGSTPDADSDGYDAEARGGDDCDDTDPAIHPGVLDVPYDGIDADCANDDDFDFDADGFTAEDYGGDDCADADAALTPEDLDLDGYSTCLGDCADLDIARFPGADDPCDDGIDQDCSGHDAVCPVADLEGRTYVLLWDDITFVYPSSAAVISSLDMLLLQVDTEDDLAGTLSWAGAVGSGLVSPAPECVTALDFPPTDFSANPAFSIGPADFAVLYLGTPVDVEDFALTGSFDSGASALYDLVFTGRFDTRAIDSVLGLDTCAVVAAAGDVCVPCADGAVRCLDALATAPIAAYDQTVDVIGACGL